MGGFPLKKLQSLLLVSQCRPGSSHGQQDRRLLCRDAGFRSEPEALGRLFPAFGSADLYHSIRRLFVCVNTSSLYGSLNVHARCQLVGLRGRPGLWKVGAYSETESPALGRVQSVQAAHLQAAIAEGAPVASLRGLQSWYARNPFSGRQRGV